MVSTGQYQTATTDGDGIYYSIDYGNTWTPSSASLSNNWTSVSVSSSGQYQTATTNGNGIWYSYINADNYWTTIAGYTGPSGTGVTGIYFNGNVFAVAFYTTSDYRIKNNITSLNDEYRIDNINPVSYTNIQTGNQDIGLIAHEVQEIYPYLVNGKKDSNELQSVNYTGLIPILIKEIKDLKNEVKELKAKINI
jgi:hypothetical protein